MDSNIGRNCDRISNLPDFILCHILSFLPTKYAVGTSILSTRWLYLWTYVTSFEFDDSQLLHERSETSVYNKNVAELRFMNFVNRVLFLSDAPCWKKFSLTLQSFGNIDLVNTWVSAAIKRNVQKLELCYLGNDKSLTIYDAVELPRLVYTSKTLVALKLHGKSILKLPDSVWLPNLKVLNLQELQYENEDSAPKLFSGCPVLEELLISGFLYATPLVLNISVPTLKRLIVFLNGTDVLFKSNDQRYKLVVNAPKLEHLHLSDSLTEDFSFDNLSSLLKAVVDITKQHSWLTKYYPSISELLRAIAHVKFLDFQTEVKNYVLPTFHNLTHLRLGGWNVEMLKEFLEHSPNLEVLILKGTRFRGSGQRWRPPPQLPYCLLLHLKEIEILDFRGKDYDCKVIAYLLKNAKVLKKMTIDCQHPGSCICKAFAGFPRGSKACQLNLLH